MMNNDDFTSSEQLLRYHNRSERIRSPTSSVANNVSRTQLYSQNLSWVKSRIHAGDDSYLSIAIVSAECSIRDKMRGKRTEKVEVVDDPCQRSLHTWHYSPHTLE